KQVVEWFQSLGVVFVDDVDKVPPGAPLVLSAHGTAPEVVDRAKQHLRIVVDAVCPLVTKVHHEVKVRASKGYQVIYVGHAGHEEAVGTMAVAPDAVHLVTSTEDVDRVAAIIGVSTPVALLAQTTLSHDEWRGIIDHAMDIFPDAWMPDRSDLCFATTNRQAALRSLVSKCDAVIVMGSPNSSNTLALVRVAESAGSRRVIRIDGPSELPCDLEGTIGLTAGASAPEYLVEQVIARLSPAGGITVESVTEETEYFPPPPELRELMKGLDGSIHIGLGIPPGPATDSRHATSDIPKKVASTFAHKGIDDRYTAAASVLDEIIS
ncbi:MAG: 4-hydroxy-3-methylbut-2-enyl diphosphate reductase, partial [Acidimicrobiales bacterium]